METLETYFDNSVAKSRYLHYNRSKIGIALPTFLNTLIRLNKSFELIKSRKLLYIAIAMSV